MSAGTTDAVEVIAREVLSVMPGWRFAEPPQGFGWAPARHFRAVLAKGHRREAVVIRKSWSAAGFEVERYLYGCMHCELPLATPRLWSVFDTNACDTGWMILEDVGERCADAGRLEDRSAFLAALGSLHGKGQCLVASGRFRGSPLPQFPPIHWHYDEWESLIALALESPAYGLEEWVIALLHRVRRNVEMARPTLLHGDTDYSNAIWLGSRVALIDWECACIGPASADLGRALELFESPDELESYRSAYQEATGADVSPECMDELADTGIALNSLRWICHYLRQVAHAEDPGEEWRRHHFRPSVERLQQIRARHLDWS